MHILSKEKNSCLEYQDLKSVSSAPYAGVLTTTQSREFDWARL